MYAVNDGSEALDARSETIEFFFPSTGWPDSPLIQPDRAPILKVMPVGVEPQQGLTRSIDMLLAGLILFATLPVIVLLCLAIWAQDGGSPIFAQRRVGLRGRIFPCLKLRSMVKDADSRLNAVLSTDPAAAAEWARDHKLRNDPRITLVGQFLRKSSLDELPQLFNVLMGHMSLVGPRPIVESEIPRYRRYIHYYCSVRPGITGLWQVSGRNDVSYRRRVALDTHYCRTKSIALDFWIIGRTIPELISPKGCY